MMISMHLVCCLVAASLLPRIFYSGHLPVCTSCASALGLPARPAQISAEDVHRTISVQSGVEGAWMARMVWNPSAQPAVGLATPGGVTLPKTCKVWHIRRVCTQRPLCLRFIFACALIRTGLTSTVLRTRQPAGESILF